MTPEILLHYRIHRRLGAGGMGEVYLAEDLKLNRLVALKVLSYRSGDDRDRRERFKREAKALAALNHPNIVTIYAVEQLDDVTFIVMELVDGRTLSDIIPDGGLPLDRLLEIAISLADALAAAHERGVIHRDLKPANVMVSGDGRVKVLDFGLAKFREAVESDDSTTTALNAEPLTSEGRILGTPCYMSPEQARGQALDHRTDIFSLGVVLYELATGQRPFANLESLFRTGMPPSIADVKPSSPTDLRRIIRRALIKDRDHRYQTVSELQSDLEALKAQHDAGIAGDTLTAIGSGRPRVGTPVLQRALVHRPRFFLYLSETKLAMLWPQIPTARATTICTSLGLDAPVVDSRAKMAIVTEFLRDECGFGTADDPDEYFHAALPMKTGSLSAMGKVDAYIYFSGASGDRVVGLVGSPANMVVGPEVPARTSSRGFSAYLLPDIIEAFDQVAGEFDVDYNGPTRPLDGEHIAYHMRWIDKDIHAPAQRLEFVAKRLYVDRHALLGTPLFVALAE
jgi:predicted Ser/Thr protein kinase